MAFEITGVPKMLLLSHLVGLAFKSESPSSALQGPIAAPVLEVAHRDLVELVEGLEGGEAGGRALRCWVLRVKITADDALRRFGRTEVR